MLEGVAIILRCVHMQQFTNQTHCLQVIDILSIQQHLQFCYPLPIYKVSLKQHSASITTITNDPISPAAPGATPVSPGVVSLSAETSKS